MVIAKNAVDGAGTQVYFLKINSLKLLILAQNSVEFLNINLNILRKSD